MSNALISCVGGRDPYDKGYPFFYGSLLASAHYVNYHYKNLEKIILICTPEYNSKLIEIQIYINEFFPKCEIHVLNTNLTDPSNLNLVDHEFKIALENIARDTKKKSTFINLSSGTQQMTQTLTLMLVTEYLRGIGLSVKNPFYKLSDENLELTDEPLKESIVSIVSRVDQLNKMDIPAVKHITKSNIITLIQNDNFNQAEILLDEFPDTQIKTQILKPLFRLAIYLFLQDIPTAKGEFKTLVSNMENLKLYDFYFSKISSIENALNCHAGLLCYWLTDTRKKQKRYDDFIRSVGLTREICLELHLKSSDFNTYYDSYIDKSNKSYRINTSELKRLNPELYNLCFNNKEKNLEIVDLDLTKNAKSNLSNNKNNKFVEFNNKLMLIFLNYAANLSKDEKLLFIAKTFNETKNIVYLRNDYSHSFNKISEEYVKLADKVFIQLKEVLPGFSKNGSGGSIFKFIRELAIDIIRYRFN